MGKKRGGEVGKEGRGGGQRGEGRWAKRGGGRGEVGEEREGGMVHGEKIDEYGEVLYRGEERREGGEN